MNENLLFIKMKKHPIDELFVKELGNYSLEPSQQARELFLKRLEEKNKPKGAIWMGAVSRNYWLAAASIVLLLGIGVWKMGDDKPTTTPHQLATTNTIAKKTVEATTQATPATNTVSDVATNLFVNKTENKRKNSTPGLEQEQREATSQNVAINPPNRIIDELIQDELTVAVQKAQTRKTERERENRREEHQNDKIFSESIAETVIVITEVLPVSDKILIPELDSDSPITIAKAEKAGRMKMELENSFLAKVYTEIKHLKHGEKVDLTTLNKENEQVFTLEDDGFINQEKQEINYRWQQMRKFLRK